MQKRKRTPTLPPLTPNFSAEQLDAVPEGIKRAGVKFLIAGLERRINEQQKVINGQQHWIEKLRTLITTEMGAPLTPAPTTRPACKGKI